MNLDFVCARGIQILVLSHFSQNKLIGIVLDVEFIRLNYWLDHKSFFGHCIVLLKSFELLFINRSDIDIPDLFSVKFKMLSLLACFIGLVTKYTVDKIFLNRVITVKISIFIAEIGVD